MNVYKTAPTNYMPTQIDWIAEEPKSTTQFEDFMINLGTPPEIYDQGAWCKTSLEAIIKNDKLEPDQIETAIKRILNSTNWIRLIPYNRHPNLIENKKYVQVMFDTLLKREDLSELWIDAGRTFDDEAAMSTVELIEKIKIIINNNKNISLSFNLSGTKFSTDELSSFMQTIKGMNVIKLDMKCTNISKPDQLNSFTEHLKNINIQTLDLSYCYLSNENCVLIFKALPESLENLELFCNSISDGVEKSLLIALKASGIKYVSVGLSSRLSSNAAYSGVKNKNGEVVNIDFTETFEKFMAL